MNTHKTKMSQHPHRAGYVIYAIPGYGEASRHTAEEQRDKCSYKLKNNTDCKIDLASESNKM